MQSNKSAIAAMGGSPLQHRVTIGTFAGRLCSSTWRPGSAGGRVQCKAWTEKNGLKIPFHYCGMIGTLLKVFIVVGSLTPSTNQADSPISYQPITSVSIHATALPVIGPPLLPSLISDLATTRYYWGLASHLEKGEKSQIVRGREIY